MSFIASAINSVAAVLASIQSTALAMKIKLVHAWAAIQSSKEKLRDAVATIFSSFAVERMRFKDATAGFVITRLDIVWSFASAITTSQFGIAVVQKHI